MRQISKTQRRLAAGAFLVVAAPLALGSIANACQTLATLHANPASAAVGSTVTLFGKNYAAMPADPANTGQNVTRIEVHLDERDGPLLASFDAAAVLSGTFVVPSSVSVGTHTLIATQYVVATGAAKSGTPGRATLDVTPALAPRTAGAAEQAVVAAPVAPAAPVAASAATAVASNGSTSAPGVVATPTAAPLAASTAPAVVAPSAVNTAAPSVASPAAATAVDSPVTPAASFSDGLLPVSSDASSKLPSLVLAGGLALVLLSLAAFFKSGRNMLGGRGFTPLAG